MNIGGLFNLISVLLDGLIIWSVCVAVMKYWATSSRPADTSIANVPTTTIVVNFMQEFGLALVLLGNNYGWIKNN